MHAARPLPICWFGPLLVGWRLHARLAWNHLWCDCIVCVFTTLEAFFAFGADLFLALSALLFCDASGCKQHQR